MDNNVADHEAQPLDILSLLKDKLPDYIVRCFLASGYDDPDVIATMDVTDNPGNCIAKIQTYIGSKFPDNEEYYHNGHVSLPFEFPPGHRKRICNFINEVKRLYQIEQRSNTRKRKTADQDKPLAKRPKSAPTPVKVVQEKKTVSIPSISKQIRRNLNKWLQKQTDPEICKLKENIEYAVMVNSTDKPKSFSAYIRCLMCGTAIDLQQLDKLDDTSTYLLSNWTRHVKKCIVTTGRSRFKQPAIDTFCTKKKTDDNQLKGMCIYTTVYTQFI